MSENCKYHIIDQISPRLDIEVDCDSEMAVQGTQSKKVTRKWEIFAGRNHFYCNGRLMTAPHSGVFLLTVFLITGASTLFFIFDCQYLAENVTCAIPIIGGLLFIFTMSALLRTALTDPGIIPRATSDEAEYTEKQIEVPNSANSPTYRPPPRTKEVLVKGLPVKLKYCFTCKIFRPPRASHCSICDNCVDHFDHHCPWVGNCVGKRNYRFFYMFIVSLAFLAVFMFACAIAHLILITKNDRPFLDAVKESPASVIVAVVCFFSVWSILGLAGFHTYLTTSNQTTNEDIKGSFASKIGQKSINPYSHGNVCFNCFHVLCGPVAPSLIDRRGLVTDEYRTEITQGKMENVVVSKTYGTVKNGISQISLNTEQPLPGLYRQNAEANGSNAGSVTHLVSNEAPIATLPMTSEDVPSQYTSQPNLPTLPVYSNLQSTTQLPLVPLKNIAKSQSLATNIDDLHLDPVVIRENHLLPSSNVGGAATAAAAADKRKSCDAKQQQQLQLQQAHDNEIAAFQDKENSLISASTLRLLQDTTMIESALDLDSLDDSSIGTNSQAGLMKVNIV